MALILYNCIKFTNATMYFDPIIEQMKLNGHQTSLNILWGLLDIKKVNSTRLTNAGRSK